HIGCTPYEQCSDCSQARSQNDVPVLYSPKVGRFVQLVYNGSDLLQSWVKISNSDYRWSAEVYHRYRNTMHWSLSLPMAPLTPLFAHDPDIFDRESKINKKRSQNDRERGGLINFVSMSNSMNIPQSSSPRVIIIGGGFGGIALA